MWWRRGSAIGSSNGMKKMRDSRKQTKNKKLGDYQPANSAGSPENSHSSPAICTGIARSARFQRLPSVGTTVMTSASQTTRGPARKPAMSVAAESGTSRTPSEAT